MKNLLIIIALFLAVPLMAQENDTDSEKAETLFSGKIESGGYGGAFLKVGSINNETGVFVGGLGGWVINHKLVLGGKGYGLVNNAEVNGMENIKLDFGCGGGFIEYVIASNKLVNASIHTMIGAGSVRYAVIDYQEPHVDLDYSDDGFFVMEPGVNLNINVSEKFRIGIGGAYRFVSGVDYDKISNSDLSDLSGELIFKFGIF